MRIYASPPGHSYHSIMINRGLLGNSNSSIRPKRMLTDRRLSSWLSGVVWCSHSKTVEMIVDFRRNPPALPPLTIMDSTVTAVESFRFLGTTISQDLKWDYHFDSIATKAQQRLYFPLQLKQFNLPQESLKQFYSAIIESVLCSFITVWVGSATKSDIRRLRFVCVCVWV